MTAIDLFGLTHTGRVRNVNEDQFFVGTCHKSLELRHSSLDATAAIEHFTRADGHLLVVADGVGGVAGGERASQAAVFTLATYIGQTAGCYYDVGVELESEFLERLETAVRRAHRAVQSLSTQGRGPATTLTMVMVVWPRAYVAHVGDSRVYHFRRGRLRQFTRDQTMAELLVDEGVMTDESAAGSRLQHVLASAVGSETMEPAIGLLDLVEGDALLLCTDGLTKHVSDAAIAEALTTGETAEHICRRLVAAALDGGGSDNVTVAVARAVPESASGPSTGND